MSGRKKVEAWAILNFEGEINSISGDLRHMKSWMRDYPEHGETLAHLVESSPADARRRRAERAVVRKAIQFADWIEAGYDDPVASDDLIAAVSRLKQGGKK